MVEQRAKLEIESRGSRIYLFPFSPISSTRMTRTWIKMRWRRKMYDELREKVYLTFSSRTVQLLNIVNSEKLFPFPAQLSTHTPHSVQLNSLNSWRIKEIRIFSNNGSIRTFMEITSQRKSIDGFIFDRLNLNEKFLISHSAFNTSGMMGDFENICQKFHHINDIQQQPYMTFSTPTIINLSNFWYIDYTLQLHVALNWNRIEPRNIM